MTIDEITEAVEHIRQVAGDEESAHSCEDKLRAAFISYVAKRGPPKLAAMAKLVLSTKNVRFDRWYS